MDTCDFSLADQGSIVMLFPESEAAQAWIDEHVCSEPWQWLSGGLAIEPRYASDLMEGAADDGLTFRLI